MQLNAETRLQDLADTYPWLIETVASMDERLKSPILLSEGS